MQRNRSRFIHMDDALRLLIFIEIANTVKLLIMQLLIMQNFRRTFAEFSTRYELLIVLVSLEE